MLGYTKGALAYFSLHFADPGHDAKGFGFVGIKGSGFAEENHPFSNPSFGIVGHNKIDYPFNIGCGTAQQQRAYVEAWLYGKAGVRSQAGGRHAALHELRVPAADWDRPGLRGRPERAVLFSDCHVTG